MLVSTHSATPRPLIQAATPSKSLDLAAGLKFLLDGATRGMGFSHFLVLFLGRVLDLAALGVMLMPIGHLGLLMSYTG